MPAVASVETSSVKPACPPSRHKANMTICASQLWLRWIWLVFVCEMLSA